MSGYRPSALALRPRVVLVCAALALALVGCGAGEVGGRDDAREAQREKSIRSDAVVSQVRVVPIAREAIERRLPREQVTVVVCTSEVMYVSDGSVTQCTAEVNDVATGWTLTFRDSAGAYRLASRPGAPWEFSIP